MQAELLDAEGRTVASGTGREEIALRVASPCLWTAETPYLYTLRLSNASDEISLQIGLRESCLRPDGLYINGRRTILKGMCLHQDFACRGVAVKAELWRARLRQLKKIGCNALRLAHHVFAEEFLDLCDEMGFYVYEEAFDKWHSGLYGRYFDEDWRHDLDAMVLRDRNRPSVLLWGVGNEVENQAHAGMIDTLKTLVARVRELDNTRPVTYAMNPHFKRPAKVDLRAVKDIQAFVDEIDDREIYELNERLDCVSRIAACVDLIAGNYQEPWYDDIHACLPEKYPPLYRASAFPRAAGENVRHRQLRLDGFRLSGREHGLALKGLDGFRLPHRRQPALQRGNSAKPVDRCAHGALCADGLHAAGRILQGALEPAAVHRALAHGGRAPVRGALRGCHQLRPHRDCSERAALFPFRLQG